MRRIVLGLGVSGVLLVAVWLLAVRLIAYPEALLVRGSSASLTLTDRHGSVLWQGAGSQGGRETWTPLARISPHLRQATLAAEDHRFFEHSGIDPWGVVRAMWLNLQRGRRAFGASTLTMQLARLLRPELAGRSLVAKARQAFDAARLERRLTKQEILEHYLNRVYYGRGVWGAAAAARYYFDTTPEHLAPAAAALLAVLPRGPRLYDPDRNPEGLRARQAFILERMRALGWLDEDAYALALALPLPLARKRPEYLAPHFVDWVRQQLPTDVPPGARVTTTLALPLQERLEVAVRRHLATVGGRHLTQAGVVVMRNDDGAILALVGSADYFDKDAGAVNIITAPRRPGSTLKPFVYALSMERGAHPATLAYDVVLPEEVREAYTADVKQHGLARYREALAGSYNLAAVHTLKEVGVPALLQRLRAAGVHSLRERDEAYGLGLAIGEAHFTVLEYAGAFAAFGTGGFAVTPHAIDHIDAPSGRQPPGTTPNAGARPRVFTEDIAYLIFDMLSDSDARRPMFGGQAPMALPFPVALKTGTTRAYTDNLAFGTTAEYTVGVWGGNFDGTPTQSVMSMQGAAPLVRATFVAIEALYGEPNAPPRPANLLRAPVCALSGKHAGPYCPGRKWEWFIRGTAPNADEPCTLHTLRCGEIHIDFPPELELWARSMGLDTRDPCGGDPQTDAPPAAAFAKLRIVYPADGARFRLDPHRPAASQVPPLHAVPSAAPIEWRINGTPAATFVPTPGTHRITAHLAGSGFHSAVPESTIHVTFDAP